MGHKRKPVTFLFVIYAELALAGPEHCVSIPVIFQLFPCNCSKIASSFYERKKRFVFLRDWTGHDWRLTLIVYWPRIKFSSSHRNSHSVLILGPLLTGHPPPGHCKSYILTIISTCQQRSSYSLIDIFREKSPEITNTWVCGRVPRKPSCYFQVITVVTKVLVRWTRC